MPLEDHAIGRLSAIETWLIGQTSWPEQKDLLRSGNSLLSFEG